MKKQHSRGGIGFLAALCGGFIGLSLESIDTTFGKIMLAIGIVLTAILIITIIRLSKK